MYYFNESYCQDLIKEIFIKKPLSFLNGDKLNYIISAIKENNLTNILEIGTFAGGTTYLLSKEFPNSQITTIDLNNFDEYFKDKSHKKILTSIKEGYPEVGLKGGKIKQIQSIYKSLSPNATFLTGDLKTIDITKHDAIIVDGDHTYQGLMSDLEYCYRYMQPGLIFVDDCVHKHITQCCKDFCLKYNAEFEFAVYCDYNTISGKDLCIIKKH